MNSAQKLYRSYKKYSTELFTDITGKDLDDIATWKRSEIVGYYQYLRDRHNCNLRCMNGRIMFRDKFVPKEKRDAEHEKAILAAADNCKKYAKLMLELEKSVKRLKKDTVKRPPVSPKRTKVAKLVAVARIYHPGKLKPVVQDHAFLDEILKHINDERNRKQSELASFMDGFIGHYKRITTQLRIPKNEEKMVFMTVLTKYSETSIPNDWHTNMDFLEKVHHLFTSSGESALELLQKNILSTAVFVRKLNAVPDDLRVYSFDLKPWMESALLIYGRCTLITLYNAIHIEALTDLFADYSKAANFTRVAHYQHIFSTMDLRLDFVELPFKLDRRFLFSTSLVVSALPYLRHDLVQNPHGKTLKYSTYLTLFRLWFSKNYTILAPKEEEINDIARFVLGVFGGEISFTSVFKNADISRKMTTSMSGVSKDRKLIYQTTQVLFKNDWKSRFIGQKIVDLFFYTKYLSLTL